MQSFGEKREHWVSQEAASLFSFHILELPHRPKTTLPVNQQIDTVSMLFLKQSSLLDQLYHRNGTNHGNERDGMRKNVNGEIETYFALDSCWRVKDIPSQTLWTLASIFLLIAWVL